MGEVKPTRKTCAACGQPDVPHRKTGAPFARHFWSERHHLAVMEARQAAKETLEREPVTAWCPHEPCGAPFKEREVKDGSTPYHDFPKPCRQVCPGSKRLPLRLAPASETGASTGAKEG